MTPTSMPLDTLLGYVSNSDQDALREILEHTLQALIEVEAAQVVVSGCMGRCSCVSRSP